MNNRNPEIQRTNKLKLTWGLICLIGPTALIILTFLAFAIFNFISSATVPAPDFSGMLVNPPAKSVMNIIMFGIGALSVLTFVPGIIVGTILLATRK